MLSTAAHDDARECDISGLLEMLGKVPDPRSVRGRIYKLSFILAVSLAAVLAGASSFRQIRDQVADMPQSLVRKLGGKWRLITFRVMMPFLQELVQEHRFPDALANLLGSTT